MPVIANAGLNPDDTLLMMLLRSCALYVSNMSGVEEAVATVSFRVLCKHFMKCLKIAGSNLHS